MIQTEDTVFNIAITLILFILLVIIPKWLNYQFRQINEKIKSIENRINLATVHDVARLLEKHICLNAVGDLSKTRRIFYNFKNFEHYLTTEEYSLKLRNQLSIYDLPILNIDRLLNDYSYFGSTIEDLENKLLEGFENDGYEKQKIKSFISTLQYFTDIKGEKIDKEFINEHSPF